jgi:hypothetical protein
MKKKRAALIALLVAGLVSSQSARADVFKLFKFTDEVLDVLRGAGKYGDEAVEVIRQAGRYGDEATEVIRRAGRYGDEAVEAIRRVGRYGDEAVEAIRRAGRYGDEAVEAIRQTGRYGDEAVEAIRQTSRYGDEALENIPTAINSGKGNMKRVYIDEYGAVYDTSPQGMAAWLETYENMIAKGTTAAEAKTAANIAQQQMDDICLNGYIGSAGN